MATNAGFLQLLIGTAAFAGADLDTALIEREHAALFEAVPATAEPTWSLAALAWLLHDRAAARSRATRIRPGTCATAGAWENPRRAA